MAFALAFLSGVVGKTGAEEPSDPAAMHEQLFVKNRFPSAKQCAKCHPTHYREWSASQHAYAQLSPIFNTMQATLVNQTNGTLGDFCIRCHTPVGMSLEESVFMPNEERHPVSREGVTCIACHRVSKAYGKVNGRRGIEQGPLTMTVQGPTGNRTQIEEAIARGDVSPDPNERGAKIHGDAERFFQLTESGFCGSCHDVMSPRGFRLEEAFSHYKSSPAAKAGVSCQDCHMGLEPGRFSGDEKSNYAFGSAARVAGEWTPPRKLTNHMIVGPDYSVIHPALFPHGLNTIKEEADDMNIASIRDWLTFDWKAGWGTDGFERGANEESPFPERWKTEEDRRDGRELIDHNLALLEEAREARLTLLRNGYLLEDVVVERNDKKKLVFKVKVANGTDGHPVPTGFDAERLVWLHVTVTDADGRVRYESGNLDPNGDVRDLHSAYVHDRKLPLDRDLFSLQSKFMLKTVRGGEREEILPINHSLSPLPYVRPPTQSNILTGQPYDVRKHRHGIPPEGHRWATYSVSRKELGEAESLTVTVRLKAAMVPVNLVHAIEHTGFDYGMTTDDVVENLIAGHEVLWEKSVVLK